MLLLNKLSEVTEWSERPVMEDQRYYDACNVLLTLQNSDGGYATYENNRGYAWYEWLNPSEVSFGTVPQQSHMTKA